jgi:uncharacterized protein YgiB involved in biofilm formation
VKPTTRKRSSHVALAIVGAAAFALAGCQESQTEAAAFPDIASCKAASKADGWFSQADCDAAFVQAQTLHDETAPRYESQELCEQEHGPAACQSASGGSGSGGGIFMPMFMGYMIGQALGGGRPIAQPVMGRSGGGFVTPGGTGFGRMGTGAVPASTFDKAPTTKGQPAMSKAQVRDRGGFGNTATRRSVGG